MWLSQLSIFFLIYTISAQPKFPPLHKIVHQVIERSKEEKFEESMKKWEGAIKHFEREDLNSVIIKSKDRLVSDIYIYIYIVYSIGFL